MRACEKRVRVGAVDRGESDARGGHYHSCSPKPREAAGCLDARGGGGEKETTLLCEKTYKGAYFERGRCVERHTCVLWLEWRTSVHWKEGGRKSFFRNGIS
jgi:hypothetical protein